MAEPTPIETLSKVLDFLALYPGYKQEITDARSALAEVEAVVAAFRQMDKEYRGVLGLGDEFRDAALARFGKEGS